MLYSRNVVNFTLRSKQFTESGYRFLTFTALRMVIITHIFACLWKAEFLTCALEYNIVSVGTQFLTYDGVSKSHLHWFLLSDQQSRTGTTDSLCPLGGSGGASSTLDSDQELRNCNPSGGLLVLTVAGGLLGKENGLLWERWCVSLGGLGTGLPSDSRYSLQRNKMQLHNIWNLRFSHIHITGPRY